MSGSLCRHLAKKAVPLITGKRVPAYHTSGQCLAKKKHVTKDLINHSRIRGIDILRNPKLNKGTAFTLKERQLMGIHGLIPPAIRHQDDQVVRAMTNFHKRSNDLDRYIYLKALQDRNERLFYRVLVEHVELMMPIVYTPTVGQACQEYGIVFRRPRGLFLTINDAGHLYEMLCNWPERDIKAIVVTDGERILGLGDLGAYGMGIPVGKLSLYTALGGIPPEQCLPIMLDVGTNNKKLHEDPLYIGLNRPRETGEKYDALIDEFLQAAVKRFGQNVLIQFEDFANHNAFRFLQKYRDSYCMFNDDIQGTASVAAAGIIASMRITGKKLADNVFVFQGAGEASIGIASLLTSALEDEGISHEEALKKIFLVDSKGLIVKHRAEGGVTGHKVVFAQDHKPMTDLEEIVQEIKPSVLIGAAAIPGVFTEKILRSMGKNNERPVIFSLSNPTSKSECTAQQAYDFTEGRCVFASGSPFPPVMYDGKTFHPGQGNNAYIFPGVALGVTCCGVHHVPDSIFLNAAKALAKQVTQADLDVGRVYPPLSNIREVSLNIATNLAEFMYSKGLASHYPEPYDKREFIQEHIYSTDYESFEPDTWDWPIRDQEGHHHHHD
ncbi:NADP-dependent malic enzyme-like [Gigantopelta aegis]|uniref:NADP-dependent malic enzyme-like n=1 Tax=Gigantopelta aegis TaxID=1735272 RepID=UPI001B887F93|nr:NADP-dependent malic enzyme-like [Gigantopelta aegis]